MKMVGRWLGAFGHFWWDFLIGDTPELFAVVVVVIGLAFVLRHDRTAGVIVVIGAVVASLGLSTWRGRRRTA